MTERAAGVPIVGSVAFRVCMFFAVNPDEELQTADVATKFGCPVTSVTSLLRPVSLRGWVAEQPSRGRGMQTVYRPGPRLLELLGSTR